ncbi:MAG: undecaprenyl-diphosphate phosphatase [Chloroflexota bacterium]|nr:undecaprenyl-diphosphate phosphatase [Chloroflexota bacterium]
MEVALQALVIGLLQGLTEFIPISSSAHLELAPWLLGWEPNRLIGSLAFDVFLHLGTALALLAYFARDWLALAGAFIGSVVERRIGDDPRRRLAWLLALGTLPAAALGFALEGPVEELFHAGGDAARLAIAGFLVVGALLLAAADRWGSHRRDLQTLRWHDAVVVGLAQGLALLPGISRSGSTIAAGLGLGLKREAAARFSFLLATPITLGAGLYGSRRLVDEHLSGSEWVAVGVGFVAATLAGMLAIGLLLAWLRRRSVLPFAVYRLVLAATVVVLVVAGR